MNLVNWLGWEVLWLHVSAEVTQGSDGAGTFMMAQPDVSAGSPAGAVDQRNSVLHVAYVWMDGLASLYMAASFQEGASKN